MKYLTGILLGVVVLIGGLFLVFKFIVSPKAAVVQPGAPAPLPTAHQTVQPTVAQTAIATAPAIISALGSVYGSIFGTDTVGEAP